MFTQPQIRLLVVDALVGLGEERPRLTVGQRKRGHDAGDGLAATDRDEAGEAPRDGQLVERPCLERVELDETEGRTETLQLYTLTGSQLRHLRDGLRVVVAVAGEVVDRGFEGYRRCFARRAGVEDDEPVTAEALDHAVTAGARQARAARVLLGDQFNKCLGLNSPTPCAGLALAVERVASRQGKDAR